MTDKNTPKSFIEWLGYTTTPRFLKARWLGATIGGIAALTIASAVMLSIVQFFIAATGISTSATIHADARNYALILAALLSIPFVIWRVLIAQKQADIAEQSHMTDRITKAVEQLGSEKTVKEDGVEKTVPNLEVRLGAIYALERIAQDSLRDHIPVMEILCAYVRNNAPDAKAVEIEEYSNSENFNRNFVTELEHIPHPRVDIQSALTVIGRRKNKHIKFERDASANPIKQAYQLNLSNTNLQKLDLSEANLANANLMDAKMQGAYLLGTDLRGTTLVWAKMQGVKLNRSKMQGANLYRATMLEADFNDAVTNFAAIGSADLSNAINLTEVQVKSMFGDASTILPEHLAKPDWAKSELSWTKFYKAWQAAKAAANL